MTPPLWDYTKVSSYRQPFAQALGYNSGRRLLPFLCVLLLLAACGDESDDRQFANGNETPRATSTAAPLTDGTPMPSSPVAIASPISTEALIAPRGGGDLFAFAAGDIVYLVHSQQGQIEPLWEGDGGRVWHAERSPATDETAVLVSGSEAAANWRVILLDDEGDVRAEIPIHASGATPRSVPDAVVGGSGGLAWSPDGERLAVAVPTGGLFEIVDRSRIETMVPPSRASRPGELAWSQGGRAVAFVNKPTERGGSGIYVAPAGANPLDPVTLLAPDSTGNRTVGQLQWLTVDDILLAVIYRQPAPNTIGDLFRLSVSAATPELVASGQAIAFRASIEKFSSSPDDAVLLYAVRHDPDEETPWTVVLKQQGGPTSAEIPVPEGERVDDLVWTSAGPVIVTTSEGDAEEAIVSVYTIDDELGLRLVDTTAEAPPATPVASPAGSPAASPVAVEGTPVGSPIPVEGTPVASPVASPEASPVAEEA